MSVEGMNPAAPEHLPFYVAMPGQTDVILWSMGIFLLLAVIGIGVFYFKLHALPEHMAHSGQKVQFEIVAVLALLALFTHNHLYWVAGLLLALIPLPDLSTPLASMARSLGKMAGEEPAPEDRSGTTPTPTNDAARQSAEPAHADDAKGN